MLQSWSAKPSLPKERLARTLMASTTAFCSKQGSLQSGHIAHGLVPVNSQESPRMEIPPSLLWHSPYEEFFPFPTGISLAIACAYWLPNLCWAPHSAHLQWKMVFRLLFSLPASRTKSSVPPVVSFHIFLFSCLCSFPVALQSQKLTHHISINPATS